MHSVYPLYSINEELSALKVLYIFVYFFYILYVELLSLMKLFCGIFLEEGFSCTKVSQWLVSAPVYHLFVWCLVAMVEVKATYYWHPTHNANVHRCHVYRCLHVQVSSYQHI